MDTNRSMPTGPDSDLFHRGAGHCGTPSFIAQQVNLSPAASSRYAAWRASAGAALPPSFDRRTRRVSRRSSTKSASLTASEKSIVLLLPFGPQGERHRGYFRGTVRVVDRCLGEETALWAAGHPRLSGFNATPHFHDPLLKVEVERWEGLVKDCVDESDAARLLEDAWIEQFGLEPLRLPALVASQPRERSQHPPQSGSLEPIIHCFGDLAAFGDRFGPAFIVALMQVFSSVHVARVMRVRSQEEWAAAVSALLHEVRVTIATLLNDGKPTITAEVERKAMMALAAKYPSRMLMPDLVKATGVGQGSLAHPMSDLQRRRLVHNDRRKGYVLSPAGLAATHEPTMS
jgi:hypothetical protein